MQSPLEQYLNQLNESLNSLPAEQRDAELREVRQHLELLIAQHRKNGESEDEAMRAVINQFGRPHATGKDLKWAWRRGRNRAQRQALKRNFRVVVGTRQGQAAINWPGAILLSALIVVINVVVTVAMSFMLTRDYFFLVPQTLTFGIPMQLTTIVGFGIKRALQMPPEQLKVLD